MSELVAGLDPGRDKCGIAIVNRQGECVFHQIVPTVDLEKHLQSLQVQYQFTILVMGDGTTSKKAHARVIKALPELKIIMANEYRTTDEARKEYWRIHKPTGWRRFVPQGMLVPPEPVDDLAALILARRYVLD